MIFFILLDSILLVFFYPRRGDTYIFNKNEQ
jgi:hypothetical protein